MAQKRMFTMKIVDSDAFLDMPLSTQALYFHLNMRADDDGFIGNPKRIISRGIFYIIWLHLNRARIIAQSLIHPATAIKDCAL